MDAARNSANARTSWTIPAFLEPLLEAASPGGRLKLDAAWDGLSAETQIAVLTEYRTRDAYIPETIAKKALRNHNAYVRYLAATGN